MEWRHSGKYVVTVDLEEEGYPSTNLKRLVGRSLAGSFNRRRFLPRLGAGKISFFGGARRWIGWPVIWHRHPLGRVTKTLVSVRRWIIASTPILESINIKRPAKSIPYRCSRVSHSGAWSAVTMVLTKKLVTGFALPRLSSCNELDIWVHDLWIPDSFLYP